MKNILINLMNETLAKLWKEPHYFLWDPNVGVPLPPFDMEPIPIPAQIERTRDSTHGDFACNVAMVLAKIKKQKPRDIAEMIKAHFPENTNIDKIEIAGPGFINFFLNKKLQFEMVEDIIEKAQAYGNSETGKSKKIIVEFLSTNPTGPMHVGHGRIAAVGDSVANLLSEVGFTVHREYYVNDAGRQMDILATSTWLRYLELYDAQFLFPSNGYKGGYIKPIAEMLRDRWQDQLLHPITEVFKNVPPDFPETGKEEDKETHIDALIHNAKTLMGPTLYRQVFDLVLEAMLDDIRNDLEEFRVSYDEWFSERKLIDQGGLQHVIDRLSAKGYCYTQEGALWFKATQFGDEKDRVVMRSNGQSTYFAADIAYHLYKYERGFDKFLDVFGADHHGYVPRVRAALQALEITGDVLDVLLVQFAVLYRGKERVQMSTRSGSFVTLRELRQEVGNDAARFFYVMRKTDQHLDFDLELAKSQSADNPVYYIQYAHARICSVFKQAGEKNRSYDPKAGLAALDLLKTSHETALLRLLSTYQETVELAAASYEPQIVAQYLRELAHAFHSYYNAEIFLVEDHALCQARLTLITAVRHVLANGLRLLGVSAPEAM